MHRFITAKFLSDSTLPLPQTTSLERIDRMSNTVLSEVSGHTINDNANASHIVNGHGASIEEDFLAPDGDYADKLATLTELQRLDSKHEFDLLQLVVCGEQSAGKSSVLEAITCIPFPRGEGTCTRFVTQ